MSGKRPSDSSPEQVVERKQKRTVRGACVPPLLRPEALGENPPTGSHRAAPPSRPCAPSPRPSTSRPPSPLVLRLRVLCSYTGPFQAISPSLAQKSREAVTGHRGRERRGGEDPSRGAGVARELKALAERPGPVTPDSSVPEVGDGGCVLGGGVVGDPVPSHLPSTSGRPWRAGLTAGVSPKPRAGFPGGACRLVHPAPPARIRAQRFHLPFPIWTPPCPHLAGASTRRRPRD